MITILRVALAILSSIGGLAFAVAAVINSGNITEGVVILLLSQSASVMLLPTLGE